MKIVLLEESGMNWVKKRPGVYVLISLVCFVCLVIMVFPWFKPSGDPAHDKASFILGLICLLFFLAVGWLPILLKDSNGSMMKLIQDEERLVIQKDGQEIMNAEWPRIKAIRSQSNGKAMVGVDFIYEVAGGRLDNCHLPLAYVDTDSINEMVAMLKENWYDKYGK